MTDAKDIIIAILGASVSLAGLLLVFGGFVFAKAETFPQSTTPNTVIEGFRKAGRLSFWPFLTSLVVAGLALAWLIFRHDCLFWSTIAGFAILLIGTATYGGVILRRFL